MLVQGPVEQTIIHSCVKSGMAFPDAIANAPDLRVGLGLFWEAFWELDSCRSLGMGIGPIPWLAVNEYCTVLQIVGDQRFDMYYHIRELDKAYIEHINKDKG